LPIVEAAAAVKKLYGKIPHLPGSRLGPADRTADASLAARCAGAGRSGDRVIVSEKLDGSCVAIVREADGPAAYGRDGGPCAASRNDGCHLADETGGDHVWNTWRDA
jgi:hypothetical protein